MLGAYRAWMLGPRLASGAVARDRIKPREPFATMASVRIMGSALPLLAEFVVHVLPMLAEFAVVPEFLGAFNTSERSDGLISVVLGLKYAILILWNS